MFLRTLALLFMIALPAMGANTQPWVVRLCGGVLSSSDLDLASLQTQILRPQKLNLREWLNAETSIGENPSAAGAYAAVLGLAESSLTVRTARSLGLISLGIYLPLDAALRALESGQIEMSELDRNRYFKLVTKRQVGLVPHLESGQVLLLLDANMLGAQTLFAIENQDGSALFRRNGFPSKTNLPGLLSGLMTTADFDSYGWMSPFSGKNSLPLWGLQSIVAKTADIEILKAATLAQHADLPLTLQIEEGRSVESLQKRPWTYLRTMNIGTDISLLDPLGAHEISDVVLRGILHSPYTSDWIHLIGSRFDVIYGAKGEKLRLEAKLVRAYGTHGVVLQFVTDSGESIYVQHAEIRSIRLVHYVANGPRPQTVVLWRRHLEDPSFREWLQKSNGVQSHLMTVIP